MKKIGQFKWTIVVVILVLIGMFMPGDDIPSVGIPYMDKIVHFGMFFCMAGTYYFEYIKSYGKHPTWWGILITLLLFAIGTELVQGMTDSRSCDIRDGMADMIGAMTSVGIGNWLGNVWFRKQS